MVVVVVVVVAVVVVVVVQQRALHFLLLGERESRPQRFTRCCFLTTFPLSSFFFSFFLSPVSLFSMYILDYYFSFPSFCLSLSLSVSIFHGKEDEEERKKCESNLKNKKNKKPKRRQVEEKEKRRKIKKEKQRKKVGMILLVKYFDCWRAGVVSRFRVGESRPPEASSWDWSWDCSRPRPFYLVVVVVVVVIARLFLFVSLNSFQKNIFLPVYSFNVFFCFDWIKQQQQQQQPTMTEKEQEQEERREKKEANCLWRTFIRLFPHRQSLRVGHRQDYTEMLRRQFNRLDQ